MAVSSRKFQAPKGTRDFYPDDMAVRRYIEGVWRQTAINHGFDEIEGPTFEHLELYTHKSGPGIVSEIFHVHSGKDEEHAEAMKKGEAAAPYALRPEFTPTLARMVAAKAAELPRPIKWFAIPQMFRAERPQRGRLREHIQWNVDFIGDDSPRADAEVIATAAGGLGALGLTSKDVTIRLSHRPTLAAMIQDAGVHSNSMDAAAMLLDRRAKIDDAEFRKQAKELSFDSNAFDGQAKAAQQRLNDAVAACETGKSPTGTSGEDALLDFVCQLHSSDVLKWCEFDLSVVRGLAYYTGVVFEIHEASGEERAIAGGGRYDNLIESFGGPPLPACGFGMGDVVLGNLLHDKGLLKEEHYLRDLRPDAFVIAADDDAAAQLPKIVAALRRERLHVRHSYKTTRNVGKLLGDASKSRARFAVILGKELQKNLIAIKDLASGEQKEIKLDELASTLRAGRGEQT